jgi:hypothetical protein
VIQFAGQSNEFPADLANAQIARVNQPAHVFHVQAEQVAVAGMGDIAFSVEETSVCGGFPIDVVGFAGHKKFVGFRELTDGSVTILAVSFERATVRRSRFLVGPLAR